MAGHPAWRVTVPHHRRRAGGGPSRAEPAPAIAANATRPPLTTVEQAAAAAHLMKHAGATALPVLDGHADQPIGIITQADITRAVADGKDVNRVRIYDLMTTTRPTVISTTTGVRDVANAALKVQDVLGAGRLDGPAGIPAPLRADQGGPGPAPRARPAGWPAARRRRQEATKTQRLRPILGERTTPHRPPGQDSTTRKRATMTGARKTSQGGPRCRPLLMTSAAQPEPTRSPIPLRASSSERGSDRRAGDRRASRLPPARVDRRTPRGRRRRDAHLPGRRPAALRPSDANDPLPA
jgi:hypothetical protein